MRGLANGERTPINLGRSEGWTVELRFANILMAWLKWS